uniref:Uncharacterized protein n=1 Tax=Anguilla anguilla TaxID=7936 RepID=A0A0E9PF09_ANGAN
MLCGGMLYMCGAVDMTVEFFTFAVTTAVIV